MKKMFAGLALLFAGIIVITATWLLSSDAPLKTLESVAIRHADKLPLEYLGEIFGLGVTKGHRGVHRFMHRAVFNRAGTVVMHDFGSKAFHSLFIALS